MSELIVSLVKNKLAGLQTSREGLARTANSLAEEIKENEKHISIVEAQIKQCEDFLAKEEIKEIK